MTLKSNHQSLNHLTPFIIILFGIITLCLSNSIVYGQKEKNKPHYKVWVKNKTNNERTVAVLGELNPSSILLYRLEDQRSWKRMDVVDIKSLKFRKKGKIGRGILIGAGVGFLSGLAIGGEDCSDDEGGFIPCQEFTTLEAGMDMAILGAIIGAAIGSCKATYKIKGDQARYEEKMMKMQKYLY